MKVFDLLLTPEGDLEIQGGDLVIGESGQQNQKLILQSNPGEWRGAPTVGVGIQDMILSDTTTTAALVSKIQEQLEADGMAVEYIHLDGQAQAFDISAYYRDAND